MISTDDATMNEDKPCLQRDVRRGAGRTCLMFVVITLYDEYRVMVERVNECQGKPTCRISCLKRCIRKTEMINALVVL